MSTEKTPNATQQLTPILTNRRRLVITQSALWFIPLALIYCTFNGSYISYHPLFAAIGYLFLVGQGLHLLKTRGQISWKNSWWRKFTHLMVSGVGTIFAAASFYIIYTEKEQTGEPHFASWHSQLGLVVLILFVLEVLIGLIGYYIPSTKKFLAVRGWTPLKIHKKIGAIAWVLALFTVILGLHFTDFGVQTITLPARLSLSFLMAILWFCVRDKAMQPTKPKKLKKGN